MSDDVQESAAILFEEICKQSETISAFVTVVLDTSGGATIGGMNLSRKEMVDVLESTLRSINENITGDDSNDRSTNTYH